MSTLAPEEYLRYGRQMILPEVGRRGQEALKRARVLVIGCGGLGCPCVAYLCGAGVGVLGLCDGDTVEVSNLPRQILHATPSVGEDGGSSNSVLKVDSARRYIETHNPHVRVVTFAEHLTPGNALRIFTTGTTSYGEECAWDLVLDCTDTQPLRYLISDLCTIYDIPMVSGSALKCDGQLSVYNDPISLERTTDGGAGRWARGPCYRCVFPRPTPADAVQSCGEAGVLGPVVGTIGVMQALEAIKLIVRIDRATTSAASTRGDDVGMQVRRPVMHLFSAMSETPWRTIRLRPRRKDCISCGEKPTVTMATFRRASHSQSATANSGTGSGEDDVLKQYDHLCRPPPPQVYVPNGDLPDDRVSIDELLSDLRSTANRGDRIDDVGEPPSRDDLASDLASTGTFVLDVRQEVEFDICNLPQSHNVPLDVLQSNLSSADTADYEDGAAQQRAAAALDDLKGRDVLVVCRHGNDSLLAARLLRRHRLDSSKSAPGGEGGRIRDLHGGLDALARRLSDLPRY